MTTADRQKLAEGEQLAYTLARIILGKNLNSHQHMATTMMGAVAQLFTETCFITGFSPTRLFVEIAPLATVSLIEAKKQVKQCHQKN